MKTTQFTFLLSTTLISALSWIPQANAQTEPYPNAAQIKAFAGMAKQERDPVLASILFENLEVSNQTDSPLSWDTTAWAGTDFNKIYFKSEGESVKGNTDSENKLLYSRPFSSFWSYQAGLGYDTAEKNSQTWGVVGLQGLAPYFFEINADLLANDKNVGLQLDGSYDALITQRLILTPLIKLNLYGSNDIKMGIGSGISSGEYGLRLRYEFSRKAMHHKPVSSQD